MSAGIDQLDSAKRARLKAASLDRKKVEIELGDMEDYIQDLLAGASALELLIARIEQGNQNDLFPAARVITQGLVHLGTDLLSDHVDLSNALHYWAEDEGPKP